MQRTFRQLAAAQPARYLEVGTPTGLTGLFTHASPRATLMYTYSSTLDALAQLPASSLYRQSAENLTKHRMAIVASVEPPGLAAHTEKVKAIIAANAWAFEDENADTRQVTRAGKKFVVAKHKEVRDDLTEEWDGRKEEPLPLEGTRTEEERATESFVPDSDVMFRIAKRMEELQGAQPGTPEGEELEGLWKKLPRVVRNAIDQSGKKPIELEPEPQWTADQVEEIENKIGGGLIEEVIQVAEGELKLVDVMLKAKVWEDLEEKPAEGQWKYFERPN
ncbi:hypothetical protein K3495_g11445 [Podosphaera aphanis]|nr:hypothetical protein K3495_g11445 [Podosphaera aphanis]